MFLKEICSQSLYLFDQKYKKYCKILQFIPMLQSWIYQQLFQSSVSHDPSEIILICWFIINVENKIFLFWINAILLNFVFIKE